MFTLAGHLGKTVAELEHTLGASELAEWRAMMNIQPFGPDRDNFHAAIVADAVITPHVKTPPKLNHWMYQHPETKRRRENQAFIARLRARSKRVD